MALTVDAIHNFATSGSILLNQQGGLESAGKGQGLRSFFNIGDARQRNAETLTAIHHAIINDPRYLSQTVQAEAARLLSQVRTDRAIGAAQIRSIIDTLNDMVTPEKWRCAAMDIVTGRLAARGMPDFLPPSGAQGYLKLAREHVAPRVNPDIGYTHVNFEAGLDAFEATMRGLFTRLGDGAGDADVLASILGKAMRNVDGGLKAQAKLEQIVDEVKANLDESRELGAEYGEQTRLDVVEMVKDMEKGLAATSTVAKPIRALVEAGRNVPLTGLAGLGDQSSAVEINAALRNLSRVLASASTGMDIKDPGEMMAAQVLITRSAVNAMPADMKAGLLAALESDTGKNLLALYAADGVNREASNISATAAVLVQQLRTTLGRPDADQPLQIPQDPDATKLPPSVLAQFTLTSTLSGTGTGTIMAFVDKINQAGTPEVEARRGKMAATCHALVVTNISQQVGDELYDQVMNEKGETVSRTFNPDKKMIQFDRDLERGSPVYLPNGERVPQDPDAARDALVRFITGNDSAKFSEADLPTKMKMHILMSCMNQSVHGICMSAYGEALNDNPKDPYARFSGVSDTSQPRIEKYSLSKEANGDIKIHFIVHRPVKAIVLEGAVEMLGDGSYDEYEMDITFPAANLDALSRVDWTKYNHAPVNAADKSRTDTSRHITAANLVPDEYKFTGTVTMAPHMHLMAAEEEDA